MALQTAKVQTNLFRDLIRSVLRFPPSAAVAASEIVHLAVNKGRARASVAGVVVSTATVLGLGELEAFTADYRSLQAFAGILPDEGNVQFELSRKDNQLRLTCGELKLTLALTFGAVLPKPKAPDPFFIADESTVKTLKWLAGVAEKDESKPDMCCVYLRDGTAMAGNQKCIAIARTPGLPKVTLPLPLQLCSVLEPGDKLAKTDGGLMLTTGCGLSQVPYLVSSLKFPVATVDKLDSSPSDVFGRVKSEIMAETFRECADCVARIPKSQAYMALTFGSGKIQIVAQSQTATFRTVMDGKVEKEGELMLELPEAEEALIVFNGDTVICKKLQHRGAAVLEGETAKAFFAPIKLGTI